MKFVLDKIIALILSAFMLFYAVYQGYRFVNKPYQTEIAYDYTVTDSLLAKGFFIRDENVITINDDGVIKYLYDDGKKVANNALIAEVFENENAVKNSNDINKYSAEVALLKTFNQTKSVSYSGTKNITNQIFSAIIETNNNTSQRILTNIDETNLKITTLLNKRSVALGKNIDYSQTIFNLENQIENLKNQSCSSIQKITCEENGYFVSHTDGFENRVNSDFLETMTINKFDEIINDPINERNYYQCKILQSHNWNFAFKVSKDDALKFRIGDKLKIDFSNIGMFEIEAFVENIITPSEENDDSIIIIKSNFINSELLKNRIADINVNFKTYCGLKIDNNAVRFKDNQKGVYIIDDEQVKFKLVDIIYEGNGYIIVNSNPADDTYVKIFDEIIVEGAELSDGKQVG